MLSSQPAPTFLGMDAVNLMASTMLIGVLGIKGASPRNIVLKYCTIKLAKEFVGPQF